MSRPYSLREGRIERLAAAHGVTPYALLLAALVDSGGRVADMAGTLCVSEQVVRRALASYGVRSYAYTRRITRIERIALSQRTTVLDVVRVGIARHGSARAYARTLGTNSTELLRICGPDGAKMLQPAPLRIRIGEELFTAKELYELWGPVDSRLARSSVEDAVKRSQGKLRAADVLARRLRERGIKAHTTTQHTEDRTT